MYENVGHRDESVLLVKLVVLSVADLADVVRTTSEVDVSTH